MKNQLFGKGTENNFFKRTEEGEVFYPVGPFGAGFVVDEEQKSRLLSLLQRHLSRNAALAVFAAFAGGFRSLGALLILIPAVTMNSAYYYVQRREILGNAPRSIHRVAWSEDRRNIAARISNARLIFILATFAVFTAGSLFVLLLTLTKFELKTFLIALAGLVLSSAFLVLGCRIAWFKWREARGS
jgi:hypothetical protein